MTISAHRINWYGKMPSFYNRVFELFVSDRDNPFIAETTGRQFRVVFNVLLDFGGFNTYAEIIIYGLSRSTEAKILKKHEYVALRAGYEDSIDYIFKGEIVNLIREKHLVRIICKGGALAQDTKTINVSLGGGVTPQALCRACASAMDLPIVINDDDFSGQSPYISGYVMAGDPKMYLNKLGKAHNFGWLIEGEKIVIVGNESSRSGLTQIISAANGMVGVPEITEVGANVTVKLSPSIKIGGRFEIKSEFAQVNYSNIYFQDVPETLGQGTYNIHKLEFTGDSYGDSWDTRITGHR